MGGGEWGRVGVFDCFNCLVRPSKIRGNVLINCLLNKMWLPVHSEVINKFNSGVINKVQIY